MDPNSWASGNTKRLILIGLGVTAAVGIGLAVFNRIFATEEKKVTKTDIQSFFAKKLRRNLEVKDGHITEESILDIFSEVRGTIDHDLTKIQKKRDELKRKIRISGATEQAKALLKEYDAEEQQLVEGSIQGLMDKNQIDPEVYERTLHNVNYKMMIKQLEKQGGTMVHPVHSDIDLLLQILDEIEEEKRVRAAEDPDVRCM
jgi:hypothetical protein